MTISQKSLRNKDGFSTSTISKMQSYFNTHTTSTPSIDKNIEHPSISDFEIDINFFDRMERIIPIKIPNNNICVISNNAKELAELSKRIENEFTKSGKTIKTIDAIKFEEIRSTLTKRQKYIILFNTDIHSKDTLKSIVEFCPTRLILKLEGVRLSCSLNSLVRINYKHNKLIQIIEATSELRRNFISTLGDREFLIISGKKESVRCF